MRIEVVELHFTYPSGVHALRGIDLVVEAGEQVAVVGQNGAGKTTLVKQFNGLLRPGSGRVRIGDWDTEGKTIAQLAGRVGYVFQNPDDQLFSRTVGAEVAVGPRNLGYEPDRVEALVADALALTGLEAQREVNPYDLPPTGRKLVSIASVVAMDTPILVLDEPTTGQDAAAIALIGRLVATLRQRGKTVLAVTHDIDFAAEQFERMLVLGQGQVLLDAPVADALAQPDILAATDVEPPQLTRLGQRLRLAEIVYTPEQFLDAYRRHRRGPPLSL